MKDLNALARQMDAAAQTACRDAARDAAALARQLAPVRTGRLRASVAARENTVLADCPYAAYVEQGTRFAPAQPFLLPAALACGFAEKTVRAVREAMR